MPQPGGLCVLSERALASREYALHNRASRECAHYEPLYNRSVFSWKMGAKKRAMPMCYHESTSVSLIGSKGNGQMSAANAEPTLTAIVIGHVQGVGFRQFVRGQATRLGLCGWVRNVQDGSVEVVAQGPRAALETLLLVLQRGPRSAWVDHVAQDWSPRADLPTTFQVR